MRLRLPQAPHLHPWGCELGTSGGQGGLSRLSDAKAGPGCTASGAGSRPVFLLQCPCSPFAVRLRVVDREAKFPLRLALHPAQETGFWGGQGAGAARAPAWPSPCLLFQTLHPRGPRAESLVITPRVSRCPQAASRWGSAKAAPSAAPDSPQWPGHLERRAVPVGPAHLPGRAHGTSTSSPRASPVPFARSMLGLPLHRQADWGSGTSRPLLASRSRFQRSQADSPKPASARTGPGLRTLGNGALMG